SWLGSMCRTSLESPWPRRHASHIVTDTRGGNCTGGSPVTPSISRRAIRGRRPPEGSRRRPFGSALDRVRQGSQQRAAGASPGAAVHDGQRGGPETRQALEILPPVRRVGEVVHGLPERLAGTEDVRLGQRRQSATTLGEQVAAEQGAGVRLME